jgi:hypothetical protein
MDLFFNCVQQIVPEHSCQIEKNAGKKFFALRSSQFCASGLNQWASLSLMSKGALYLTFHLSLYSVYSTV